MGDMYEATGNLSRNSFLYDPRWNTNTMRAIDYDIDYSLEIPPPAKRIPTDYIIEEEPW